MKPNMELGERCGARGERDGVRGIFKQGNGELDEAPLSPPGFSRDRIVKCRHGTTITMFITGGTCSYCDVSPKNSHRAFFIRLFPGGEYLIMCDCCLARERRYLHAEGPALEDTASSTSLGEESLQQLIGSMQKAHLGATHRWVENFSLLRIHDWPIIATLFRSHKRFS
jgi:hypothetical protein